MGINADIDDLKIFNVAMTEEQILDQYNKSKPAIIIAESVVVLKAQESSEKGKVASKAAPSNKIIATSDINGVEKKIEVYSQGQKVAGDSATNINDLPEGTYLLKITNKPLNKITSK